MKGFRYESLTHSLPLARPSRASGFAQTPFAASQTAQVDSFTNLNCEIIDWSTIADCQSATQQATSLRYGEVRLRLIASDRVRPEIAVNPTQSQWIKAVRIRLLPPRRDSTRQVADCGAGSERRCRGTIGRVAAACLADIAAVEAESLSNFNQI